MLLIRNGLCVLFRLKESDFGGSALILQDIMSLSHTFAVFIWLKCGGCNMPRLDEQHTAASTLETYERDESVRPAEVLQVHVTVLSQRRPQ